MTALVYSLWPILGLQLLSLTAALFVHLHAPGRGVVKMLVVPLALVCLIASPVLFAQLMGYSVHWPLPAQFTMLAYQPVVKAGVKTELEIWIRDGQGTRLHRAPWTKEMEQLLKEAQQGSKGGRQARITRKGSGQNKSDGDYELRFESPADVPKEPNYSI